MRLILVLRIDPIDETCKSTSHPSGLVIVRKELFSKRRTAGIIATPILWGCLEISVGVVSTCIPALMPLFLLVLGKRRELYIKYGDEISRSTRSNKFNRMVDLGSPAPLPEGLALSTIKSNRGDDNDDVGLVPGKSHTGDILVTNQIVQVSQPTSRGEDRSQRTVEEGTA